MSLVTLDELAARLGLTTNPAVYVSSRGYKVVVDWSGRAAITTDDAAALVAEASPNPTREDVTAATNNLTREDLKGRVILNLSTHQQGPTPHEK